jgi:hypothetical protein
LPRHLFTNVNTTSNHRWKDIELTRSFLLAEIMGKFVTYSSSKNALIPATFTPPLIQFTFEIINIQYHDIAFCWKIAPN